MPHINVLPDNIADLIAAGEVVERPSSVIKEFTENSIDAGAENITVEIQNGGKTYIRVTDNGCGISGSDIRKAFLSHATSKISTADDLDSISTLGFRGEALASICAVSKVELLTRTADDTNGFCYVIEGGSEKSFEEAGCPVGTTMIVRDLFFNVPARMKFLKKDVQEGNHVSSVIERIAVSHPDIAFKYIRDGKVVFSTPGSGELKDAIYAVFGREFTSTLMPLQYENSGITLHGMISTPIAAKSNRSLQILFVNGRFVKSVLFISAIEAAYKNSVMTGKFPPCVLFLDVPYGTVDVNVHPSKTEVRFYDEKRIFDAVYNSVLSVLSGDRTRVKADFPQAAVYLDKPQRAEQIKFGSLNSAESVADKKQIDTADNARGVDAASSEPAATDKTNPKAVFTVKEYGRTFSDTVDKVRAPEKDEVTLDFLSDSYKKSSERMLNIYFDDSDEADNKTDVKPENIIEAEKDDRVSADITDKTDEAVSQITESANRDIKYTEPEEFRYVGELFNTYFVVELEKKIYLIDKHAAHERILFEKFREENRSSAQLLLESVTVTLDADEYSAVIENEELLASAGYEVTDFGDRCVKVSACPAELCDDDIEAIITEIADYLKCCNKTLIPEKLDWIYHSMACRAAVKAGNYTSSAEAEHFVRELLSREDIRYCPHGRPVLIEVSRYQIEKLFKRIN